MDIDLLFTQQGEAGIISSENLVKKAAGLVFDTASRMLTLEYVDSDYLELNIPVEPEFFERLDLCPQVHFGAIKGGHIAQAYQIPFVFLDDPYRHEMFTNLEQPKNPLEAFNYFVRACTAGQPVHRSDLGNEASMGCILGEASPQALQFAPHLARRHAMEMAPKAAPRGPGPATPGLGGSGGGSSTTIRRGRDDDQKR